MPVNAGVVADASRLRQRGGGSASTDCVARSATQAADQPDIARPKLRFVRARRLSAAP